MEILEKQVESQAEKLKEERQYRRERGFQSKEFLQSEFLNKFLIPFIEADRLGAYPKPDEKDWEIKYRYAYAKDEVYANFLSAIQSWAREFEDIKKNEETPEKSIV